MSRTCEIEDNCCRNLSPEWNIMASEIDEASNRNRDENHEVCNRIPSEYQHLIIAIFTNIGIPDEGMGSLQDRLIHCIAGDS